MGWLRFVDAGNPAPGVILQLLAGPAHGCDPPLVPGQIVLILHAAAHTVQPLEQPARRIVGVGLEHLSLWAEHREHAPLGVVGELEALAPVRLGVVFVGPDQPHHLSVVVVDGALHPAVPLDAPDLPVHQVVGDAGLAALAVSIYF